MSEQEKKIKKFITDIDGKLSVDTAIVIKFLSELLRSNPINQEKVSINVSLVKDCQDLLDKLIVNLDGLTFYDAKYIAGRLVDEISKKSMVSVSHSC